MKKLRYVALVCAAFALVCMALTGCADNKEKYVGTWYLDYNEVATEHSHDAESSSSASAESSAESEDAATEEAPVEDTAVGAVIYTAEDLETFRSVQLDYFLNIKDDGTLALDELDLITKGTWKVESGSVSASFDDLPDETCKITVDGDKLTMERLGAKYYFTKGETVDPLAEEKEQEELVMADENGMSITFESSQKLSDEIVIADDNTAKLTIDGMGVTPIGDPGYNLQIENKTDADFNVWVQDPFTVGDKEVMVYLYQTVKAGKTATAVLQFDTDDIQSKSTDALKDVKGKILLENEQGENIDTYDVEID